MSPTGDFFKQCPFGDAYTYISYIQMKAHIFLVNGFYRGAWDAPIEFSVSATSQAQARAFVNGYVPDFAIERVVASVAEAEQHYDFAIVNAVTSARFHLRNRRQFGRAVRGRSTYQTSIGA